MLVWASAAATLAHPGFNAVGLLKADEAGSLQITIVHDALAFALNDFSEKVPDDAMLAFLAAPATEQEATLADARARFESQFRIVVDEHELPFELITFPTVSAIQERRRRRAKVVLPIKMDIVARATIPPGSRFVAVVLPEVFGDSVLSFEAPRREPLVMPVRAGHRSALFQLPAPPSGLDEEAPPTPPVATRWGSYAHFAANGFSHIIPHGLDHILFVLGLFLLQPKLSPLLKQITAFTVAHTLTLTLTALGLVSLPAKLVEVTIAASVAFIGIENLLSKNVGVLRIVVAFAFGLVHGMGVATTFDSAGIAPGQLVPLLAAFTVGVETGHIFVMLVAFAALGWWRDRPWFRTRATIPLSLGILCVATFWILTRTFGT